MHLTYFQWYLVVINVIAFLLYVIDFVIYQRTGDKFHPQGLLNFSTTFGGALGTLIAFLLLERKINKVNMMSRIYTIAWLYVQLLIVLAIYGPNKEKTTVWFSTFYQEHKILCIYIVAINVITFCTFLIDKIKAVAGKWRIREVVLMGLSLGGGALGGWIAMDLFNHKVKSTHFAIGIPMFIMAHMLLIICLIIGII